MLRSHAAVFDAVVIGVPDERWGNRVAAVVQARAGQRPTLEPLAAHGRGQLAGYKIPRELHRVDQIRRSPSGKPDYPWAQDIVAMYPVFVYVAYVLVQQTGVFERHGALVSGICVAFTFHVLYETIDHVGPQLRWWVWNTALPILNPGVGVVPYASLKGFSFDIPFGIALLTRWLAAGRGQSGGRIAANVVLVSAGVWPIMFVTGIPGGALEHAGVPGETVRVLQAWVILIAAGLVTAWALIDAYGARIRGQVELPEGVEADRFALVCVVAYLAVAAVCWFAAMPSYLAARDGLTPAGDPIGWLPYSMSTAVLSIAIVAATYLGRAPERTARNAMARFGGKVAPA